MPKRWLTAAVSAALIAGLGMSTAPAGNAATHWDTFTTDLPQYITGPTRFTVSVDGPTPVCSMTFEGQDLNAEPWTFTYPITSNGSNAVAHFCDPSVTDEPFAVRAIPAFTIWNSMMSVSAVRRDADLLSRVLVANNLPSTATVVVRNKAGRVVGSAKLKPHEDRIATDAGEITGIPVSLRGVRTNTFFTVTVKSADGLVMSRKVLVAKGWAAYPGIKAGKFAPCSTVTWLFSPKGNPARAKTFITDVRRAFGYLGKLTGLDFREIPADGLTIREPARPAPMENSAPKVLDGNGQPVAVDLVLGWQNMGKSGPAGLGGSNGIVHFNQYAMWVGDRFTGFRGPSPSIAGRGWLIIHEVMHALLFDHVNDPKSIMYPTNSGTRKFSRGDLIGLHTLYPKCRA